ncbi:MAG TPA: hypothetical protein VN207_00980 [Ktedonobacteraceae bacterium]|nr:hypothetical protein [Ktedonobacteraceae bacterium]
MYEAATFDPNSAASGQFNTNLSLNGKFLAFNESNVGLNLVFSNGDVRYLAAWTIDKFTLPTPVSIVKWSQKVTLLGNTNPISQVNIEAYQPNETILGTYPMPIQHTSYIPNTVSTAMGGSTTWQNDNNISGTQVGEATVAGSPGSNIIIQNQGLVEVLQWIGGVLTQIFKTDPGAASVVKLGNTNLTTEALGNMTVDQVLTAVGNTSLSTLLTSGLATLNSLSVTNNATVGGTLGVTGATSMSTASTSGLATLNSASVTNNETVGGTLQVTGASSLDGGIIVENAVALQWEDSTDAARTVMQVDASNNVQLFGITGLDLIQLLDHTGALKMQADLVNAILKIVGTSQTVNGSTSGSMTVNEVLDGPVKVVVVEENAMFQGAGKNMVSLKKPFTTFMWIFNGGCGGVRFDSGGAAQNYNEVNWGSGGGVGTTNTVAYAPHTTAGYISHAVDAIGANGGDAGANNGITIVIGK